LAISGLVTTGFRGQARNRRKEYAREYAMGRQLQTWRSRDSQKLWLSMLVDAMEEAARPELRSQPCDRETLAAVSAQLARPASTHACVSSFSLRN
jgi:hypothetical protein